MLHGHGDDLHAYTDIKANFSSNIYTQFDHEPLYRYVANHLEAIEAYPEPTPDRLEGELAEKLGIRPEEICITNGATEAIYLIAQAFRRARTAVLQPTFAEYADACRMHEHRVRFIYHIDDLPADAETLWLCNPNNPTGSVTAKQRIQQTIETAPQTTIVMDHSYDCFTREPLLTVDEALAHENVLLLHSLTKRFAVPGLRIGYVTGQAPLIERIRQQRMPWSVNQVAVIATHYLIQHSRDYYCDVNALMEERMRMARKLSATGVVDVWPSDSHILLCKLRIGRAGALKEYLAKEHGLLIRDASNFPGLSAEFFRIAIQTPQADDFLVHAIEEWAAL